MTTRSTVGDASEAVARPNFRPSLLTGLHYLSAWATAEVLWAVLRDDALLEALEEGVTLANLVDRLGQGDARAIDGLLTALRCEGIVAVDDGFWKLVPMTEELRVLRGWFEFFMDGYRPLFQGATTLARAGAGSVERDSLHVALGSAAIGEFDSVPLALDLIDRADKPGRAVLDYGCGNASYLTALCARNPEMTAIGVEVAEDAVRGAQAHVAACGMSHRISIVHASAPDYIPAVDVDFVVFAFVLHEIVGERGIGGTVEFLAAIGARFPHARLIIIEILHPVPEGKGDLLSHDPHGRGFYNWYVWIHTVTTQRLLGTSDWAQIFARAGFKVVDTQAADPRIDSTGLEIGYALEYIREG
jgi:2-ketoarginine methyltransferase